MFFMLIVLLGVRLAFLFMKVLIISLVKHHKLVATDQTPANVKMALVKLKVTADKPLYAALEKRHLIT